MFYRVASDIKKKGATSVTNLFVQWVYHIVGMLHFWGVCITVIICGFNFVHGKCREKFGNGKG